MELFDIVISGIFFPFMFCLVGFLCARKGFRHFNTKKDKKRRCLRQTYGTIVRISSIKTKKGRAYFPTYEYEVGTEVISVEIDLGTTSCQYRRGDRVKIRYDANDPSFSYIEGYQQDSVAAVGEIILGIMAACCGLFAGGFVWFTAFS